ncbi:MAG: cupin domain-containing protein [Chloroflexi bacterium]|nr:cupin domain-containing protein [Chloroflexota bacterium]
MAKWKIQANDSRDVAPVEQVPGAFRRVLADGDRMMIIEWTMKAGVVVPVHNHPHEQSGYIVSGEMVFHCDGKDFHLTQGMAYVVSGGTPHAADFPVASVVVDIFSPPREDYRGATASTYKLNGAAVASKPAARKAAPKKTPARKPAARKSTAKAKTPAQSRKR